MRGTGARTRAVAIAAAGVMLGSLVAACGSSSGADPLPSVVGTPERDRSDADERDRPNAGERRAGGRESRDRRPKRQGRPNIVLVLMDDFSMDLLPTLRSAEMMRRRGASYEHAYVVDSLCCVSRASLFTGQYPHQTGVLTNTANTPNRVGPIGGYEAFRAYGNQRRSFNVRLQRAGYHTGFIGKFLNQYEWNPGRPIPPVPPGWSEWMPLFGSAYDGWGFASAYLQGGQARIRTHPAPPASASRRVKDRAYAGTVIHRKALDFIKRNQRSRKPYFLKVSTYAPHSRVGPRGHYAGDPNFPPAFRDRPGGTKRHGNCGRVACPDLTLDDLPGFNDDVADNRPRAADGSQLPSWRPRNKRAVPNAALASLRNRARMSQSVDRTVRDILRAVDDNTYVVFTSDNGFHIGQHGLGQGKGTPYDSDVRVPLLVVGPDVAPGARQEVVSNIDLAPTFEQLAGLRPARFRSGESFVPTLREASRVRRNYTFIEHTWAPSLGDDPDRPYSGGTMDLIPSYVAVRSRDALLVRLDLDNRWNRTRHAWEFYDYTETPWERTNTFGAPRHAATIALLQRKLRQFDRCTKFQRNRAVPRRCRAITR